jgi:hypothetical protein
MKCSEWISYFTDSDWKMTQFIVHILLYPHADKCTKSAIGWKNNLIISLFHNFFMVGIQSLRRLESRKLLNSCQHMVGCIINVWTLDSPCLIVLYIWNLDSQTDKKMKWNYIVLLTKRWDFGRSSYVPVFWCVCLGHLWWILLIF